MKTSSKAENSNNAVPLNSVLDEDEFSNSTAAQISLPHAPVSAENVAIPSGGIVNKKDVNKKKSNKAKKATQNTMVAANLNSGQVGVSGETPVSSDLRRGGSGHVGGHGGGDVVAINTNGQIPSKGHPCRLVPSGRQTSSSGTAALIKVVGAVSKDVGHAGLAPDHPRAQPVVPSMLAANKGPAHSRAGLHNPTEPVSTVGPVLNSDQSNQTEQTVPSMLTEQTQKPSNHGPRNSMQTSRSFSSLFRDNRAVTNGFKLAQVHVDDDAVRFEAQDEVPFEKTWGYCLIGCFTGPFPGRAALDSIMKGWNVSCKAVPYGKSWTVFKFEHDHDRMSVLEGGIYMAYGKTLMLKPIDHDVIFSEDMFTKIPTWVQLHDVPWSIWSETGLSKLASRIGRPFFTDKITKEKSRLNYARCLIEIDVSKPPLLEFPAILVNGSRYMQRVSYEHFPSYCHNCKEFGHNHFNCIILNPHLETAPTVGIVGNANSIGEKPLHSTDTVSKEPNGDLKSHDKNPKSINKRRRKRNRVRSIDPAPCTTISANPFQVLDPKGCTATPPAKHVSFDICLPRARNKDAPNDKRCESSSLADPVAETHTNDPDLVAVVTNDADDEDDDDDADDPDLVVTETSDAEDGDDDDTEDADLSNESEDLDTEDDYTDDPDLVEAETSDADEDDDDDADLSHESEG